MTHGYLMTPAETRRFNQMQGIDRDEIIRRIVDKLRAQRSKEIRRMRGLSKTGYRAKAAA